MFSAPVPWISALLTVVAVVGVLIAWLYGLRPFIRAASFSNTPVPDPETTSCPKASVVVYCQSDEETLMKALESLTRQDYPDYEVVIVCDAGVEYASYISDRVNSLYDNVYVTFVQPGSHNLSRHKLANTLGVKAAKGEVIVTTIANISIPSETWLSRLMAPFCGEQGKYIDVSLGVSRINFCEMKGMLRWYRQFDSVLMKGLWIGYAANSDPYRGDGYNLAFRKSVFFKHKGYAKSIYVHHGEDDLFIHEIANGVNTRVVVDHESILTTDWGTRPTVCGACGRPVMTSLPLAATSTVHAVGHHDAAQLAGAGLCRCGCVSEPTEPYTDHCRRGGFVGLLGFGNFPLPPPCRASRRSPALVGRRTLLDLASDIECFV